MADILFVHNNFPAQFGFVAEKLKREGHRCFAIASKTGTKLDGIDLVRWQTRRATTPGILPSAVRIEADLIRGGAAAKAAIFLRDKGLNPELIVGHPGWGETTYMREIFPRARQIAYAEYYYRSEGGDVGFDPEFSPTRAVDPHALYAKNAGMALAFAEADAIVAPTPFQLSLVPEVFRARSHVIHEGVDTSYVQRREKPVLRLGENRVLDGKKPIITFINRRFEPLRGFHIFMRALPRLMAEIPEAEIVVIGADEAGGYGMPAEGKRSWGDRLFSEVASKLDRSRIHFVGRVPHQVMLEALMVSWAHVYYTYPFVLSWSMLEAMALECLVIGSDTGPVRDAITNGKNGILLDFFDVDALSQALVAACRNRRKFSGLRAAARKTIVERFDRATVCEPAWLDLVHELLGQS
jgi:glycosyltransferase involved in cell wall biosynthesis